jgi:hypothetical protein
MNISKNSFRSIALITGLLLLIEVISLTGYFNPTINKLAFLLAVAITLALTIRRLEYGLLIIIGELLIGSLGHLFYFSWGTQQLSLRVALWSVIMIVWAIKFSIQLIKSGAVSDYYQKIKNFPWWRNFLWLAIFVLIGLGNAFYHQHDPKIILVDFNSWLYFLLLLPFIVVYGQSTETALNRLKNVFWAGAIFLSLKTLIFLYIFTHNFVWAPDIYSWLRQNLLGEMTPTKTGWPRIFLQSQAYSAIAFLLIFWFNQAKFKWANIFKDKNYLSLVGAGLFLSSVVLSFSRSFWLGLIIASAASLILVWRLSNWRRMISAGLWMLAATGVSFLMVYLVVAFPYWQPSSSNLSATLLSRVNDSNEAALASRWSLLPVLLDEIKAAPLLGQGFGATVSYISRDPRILQNSPSGEYTTYIFEWSYLDLWLKLGIVGLILYLWLLFRLVKTAVMIGLKNQDYLAVGLGAGLIFLAVTNIFTPYLNHPLGIGFLLISSCLIQRNRVY